MAILKEVGALLRHEGAILWRVLQYVGAVTTFLSYRTSILVCTHSFGYLLLIDLFTIVTIYEPY